MQKWEYGFLNIDFVKTKTKLMSVEGYYGAFFNGEIIVKVDLEENTKMDKEKQCLLLAFNKLGNMGWELAAYSESYFSESSDDGPTKLNRGIIFKRLIYQS